MWPDRIDVFTLLASITLLVVTVLMVYWLGTLCYKTFTPNSKTALEIPPSPTSVRVKSEMEYLGDDDGSDSTPLDWIIERPEHLRSQRTPSSSKRVRTQPILSDRTLSVSEAGKHTSKRSRRDSGDAPRSPPVLNVIWEPTQGKFAAEGPQEVQTHPPIQRQLISSTPIILKKPAPSGRGHIDEPVIVNLYYEPSTPGESIQVSTLNPAQTVNTTSAINADVAPSVSVTTTKIRTRVTEPKPGYTKKVVETHTTTKEVKRAPVDALDKARPISPALSTKKEDETVTATSTTAREQTQEKAPSLRTARDVSESEAIQKSPILKTARDLSPSFITSQVPPAHPSEPVTIVLTPAGTQVETPTDVVAKSTEVTTKSTIVREYTTNQIPSQILSGQQSMPPSENAPNKPAPAPSLPK